jgi:hypothetical protein
MLKHALHAPEAATGYDRGLNAIGGLNVHGGSGDDHGFFSGAQRRDLERGDRERANGGAEREAAEVAAGHGLPL